jgi:Ni,Fe-hydrogenase III large subunit
MIEKLSKIEPDLNGAIALLFDSPSAMARFENTGKVSSETAHLLGLVEPALRSTGSEKDIRTDYPYGGYRFFTLPVSTYHSGDCFARAYVRRLEIARSLALVKELLSTKFSSDISSPVHKSSPDMLALAMTEGWRGEICHIAITDEDGRFYSYNITDPSFHNWQGLSMALRNQAISDFPLCNKSFNLSSCGFDL